MSSLGFRCAVSIEIHIVHWLSMRHRPDDQEQDYALSTFDPQSVCTTPYQVLHVDNDSLWP